MTSRWNMAGFKESNQDRRHCSGVPIERCRHRFPSLCLWVQWIPLSASVSATRRLSSTDDATLGETIAAAQVQDLPVQGHNALEEAALTSNVIIGSKTSYSGNPPGVDFVGAGQRETLSKTRQTLDGVTIMNNLGNVTATRPSADMVSEVQMQSGNYTAQ